MPAVSILMPCYNAAATLEEALESLSSQTCSDFEAILVDDGSYDATSLILQSWARRDARFKPILCSHHGLVAALNRGLDACAAPYVARMDSDDRCYPRRLERQVAFLETHADVSVVGCHVCGFPTGQVREGFRLYMDWINSFQEDAGIRRDLFVESPLVHPSVMFRRDRIRAVGGYQDHGWAEDYDLWLRLYLAQERFACLPEVLLDWREHPARLTRTDERYSLENFLRAKAFYLAQGPLKQRDAVIVWGAGMMGRRLGKQLQRLGLPLVAYVDIDPRKIGGIRRGQPILAPEQLPDFWATWQNPALLAAVGARGARPLLRQNLQKLGLIETRDWWLAA